MKVTVQLPLPWALIGSATELLPAVRSTLPGAWQIVGSLDVTRICTAADGVALGVSTIDRLPEEHPNVRETDGDEI